MIQACPPESVRVRRTVQRAEMRPHFVLREDVRMPPTASSFTIHSATSGFRLQNKTFVRHAGVKVLRLCARARRLNVQRICAFSQNLRILTF